MNKYDSRFDRRASDSAESRGLFRPSDTTAVKNVLVNGLRAAYDVGGKGPDVVLIHGWMASKRYWHEAVDRLPGFRVWALDLFGYGDSEKPDRGYTLENYAAFVLGFLEETGIKKCAIVGHSMGGSIVAWTVLTRPQTFKAMCLVDPGLAGIATAPSRWASEPMIGFMLQLAGASTGLGQMAIKRMFGVKSPGSKIILEEARKADVRGAASCGDMMSRQTDWRSLSKLKLPAMVVFGEDDFLTNRGMDKDVKSLIPEAEMRYIEDCGHIPMLERPDEFYGILRTFLERR